MNKMKNTPVLIYNLFPRLAGRFDQWKKHIDRAVQLKFNYLYVNPFLYSGFSGSLYSIKDYNRINPVFLNMNSKKEEWEQVKDIIGYSQRKGMKFIFDLVINHTAIDSPWVKDHPEWYKKDAEDHILKPFCLDNGKKIVWGDLAELDLEKKDENRKLWEYWQDYVLKLIDLGVDGFRCDAAYQVPEEFWKILIAAAKMHNSDVEFFAETLGCDYKDVIKLSKAGFDFSFNSSKYWDFEAPWAIKQNALNIGITKSVSFAESHDTIRLAHEYNNNLNAIKLRYLFSVIFSTGVMMPIGLEFAFNKKVDVVKTSPTDWEDTGIDLSDFIIKANRLKYTYPVFADDSPIDIINGTGNILALVKTTNEGNQKALILLNKDLNNHQEFSHQDLHQLFGNSSPINDVSIEYQLAEIPSEFQYYLRPGQIIILVQTII